MKFEDHYFCLTHYSSQLFISVHIMGVCLPLTWWTIQWIRWGPISFVKYCFNKISAMLWIRTKTQVVPELWVSNCSAFKPFKFSKATDV